MKPSEIILEKFSELPCTCVASILADFVADAHPFWQTQKESNMGSILSALCSAVDILWDGNEERFLQLVKSVKEDEEYIHDELLDDCWLNADGRRVDGDGDVMFDEFGKRIHYAKDCVESGCEVKEELSHIEIIGAIARGYCHPENSHKILDVNLCNAICQEFEKSRKFFVDVNHIEDANKFLVKIKDMFNVEKNK